MKLKKIVATISLFTLVLLFPSLSYAATLEIYPQSGIVKDASKGFTVDILIDSEDEDITQVRVALKFDPDVIQVRSANKNNGLFSQWPDDESSIDNSNGVILLTGFSQSGVNTLYNSEGTKDVLARIDFDIISKEKQDIILEFDYGNTETLFTTVVMKDGSPPTNVLLSKPESGVFSFTGKVVPSTGIEPTHMAIAIGLILVAAGVFVMSTRTNPLRKKRGTVVLYE
jgi:hypothetical protein